MRQQRREKIAEIIRQEICDLLQKGSKDPRIGFVTITRVTVSSDSRSADVYFTALGKEKEKLSSGIALRNSVSYLRREIGHRLSLRFMPELRFKYDKSIEYSSHINDVLEKLKKEDGMGDATERDL